MNEVSSFFGDLTWTAESYIWGHPNEKCKKMPSCWSSVVVWFPNIKIFAQNGIQGKKNTYLFNLRVTVKNNYSHYQCTLNIYIHT